jgi:septal ring-binding cell division protein DamX
MTGKIHTALVSAIVPGVIATLGAIVLGVYQEISHQHDEQAALTQHSRDLELENIRAAASASAQTQQIEQSIRDQNKRDQIAFMHDLAPRVAGSTGSITNCPWVMALWQSAYPDSPAPVLSASCPSVPEPPEEHWMVSAGTSPLAEAACELAGEAGKKSLPDPRVFKRPINGSLEYITTVGDYSSKSEAEPIAAVVRARVRFSASVVLNQGWALHTCLSAR